MNDFVVLLEQNNALIAESFSKLAVKSKQYFRQSRHLLQGLSLVIS